jgi:hypothetical protein
VEAKVKNMDSGVEAVPGSILLWVRADKDMQNSKVAD